MLIVTMLLRTAQSIGGSDCIPLSRQTLSKYTSDDLWRYSLGSKQRRERYDHEETQGIINSMQDEGCE